MKARHSSNGALSAALIDELSVNWGIKDDILSWSQGLQQDIDNHKVAVDDLNKAAKDLHGVGAKDPVIDEETSGLTDEYNALAVKTKVKAVKTGIVFDDLAYSGTL